MFISERDVKGLFVYNIKARFGKNTGFNFNGYYQNQTNSFKDHIIMNKKRKVKHALKSFDLGFRLEWVPQGRRQFPYSHLFHDPG